MNQLKTQMQARMQLYAQVRDFFDQRNVVEVETPILSPFGSTDVHIDSFVAPYVDQEGEQPLYLHTSPEFAMKQLLVDGVGDCFQIAKVFRHESAGRNHRPEFTMLEWYRLGFDLSMLMAEVALLVKHLFPHLAHLRVEQLTYAEAFSRIDVDPHTDELATLKDKTRELSGYLPNLSEQRDEWLDFLLVTQIEHHLGRDALTFVTHYPASMAALAKKTRNANGDAVAERFELYYQGIELANGFDELTDADEQLARFQADNAERARRGKPVVPHDTHFIAALNRGLPHCAGVAVGVDRLLMLGQSLSALDEVLVFPSPSLKG